jgi:hypothetical protein
MQGLLSEQTTRSEVFSLSLSRNILLSFFSTRGGLKVVMRCVVVLVGSISLSRMTAELEIVVELFRTDDLQYNASSPAATNDTTTFIDDSVEQLRETARAIMDVSPHVAWSHVVRDASLRPSHRALFRFAVGFENGVSIWYHGVNASTVDIPINYSGSTTGEHLFEIGRHVSVARRHPLT